MPRSTIETPENVATADKAGLASAISLLRAGEPVAIPTETVYGLAADAGNPAAVAAIYRAKGRPDFNPLIVHVPDIAAAGRLAEVGPAAERLAGAFWPGALTMVLPLREGAAIAPAVTAGLGTIALRCPAHTVMQAVLRISGLALAAPSANRSGAISPTTAAHVAASLGERVQLILDGGPTSMGLESTIVALDDSGWRLLRPGPITAADIAALLGPEAPLRRSGSEAAIESPGQLASHYAPTKPLRLDALERREGELLIGFGNISGDITLSASGDLWEAAARLYGCLHQADAATGATGIAVAPVPESGVGVAINDRLRRASA